MKRCGKCAPRLRQRRRHGKPHREQDRIGAARGAIPGSMSGSAARVGCSKRRATGVPEEWPSRARHGLSCALQNPAYRPAGVIRGARRETAGRPTNFRASGLPSRHRACEAARRRWCDRLKSLARRGRKRAAGRRSRQASVPEHCRRALTWFGLLPIENREPDNVASLRSRLIWSCDSTSQCMYDACYLDWRNGVTCRWLLLTAACSRSYARPELLAPE